MDVSTVIMLLATAAIAWVLFAFSASVVENGAGGPRWTALLVIASTLAAGSAVLGLYDVLFGL